MTGTKIAGFSGLASLISPTFHAPKDLPPSGKVAAHDLLLCMWGVCRADTSFPTTGFVEKAAFWTPSSASSFGSGTT